MKIHLDNYPEQGQGMGDHLSLISLLCDVPDSIEVYSNNNHGVFDTLSNFKRVLNIPDEQFKLIYTPENGDFRHWNFHIKLFSKYYNPETVHCFNRDIAVSNDRKKGYIGLVCYRNADNYIDEGWNIHKWVNGRLENLGAIRDEFEPRYHLKFRPVSYYERIFGHLKRNGYDVITLDSDCASFEEKVDFMVNHCQAIVGIEGGVAHLAHILDIPYIMIDWDQRFSDQDVETGNFYGEYHSELFHMTDNVWIMRDDQEIFTWNRSQLDCKINDLKNGLGNNRFINGDCTIDFDNSSGTAKLLILDEKDRLVMTRSHMYIDDALGRFITKYYS